MHAQIVLVGLITQDVVSLASVSEWYRERLGPKTRL
jgi:hypothetical protein